MFKLYILLLACFTSIGYSAYCNGQPEQYYNNTEAIWSGQPRLIRSHRYGQLFEIGTGTATMKLLHVYGNMYQMGFAHGSLLREQLRKFVPQLWEYIQEMIEQALPKYLPQFLKKGIANFAASAALDLTYEVTRAFTNNKYFEQMRGIADASGLPYKYARRIHMVGEITKGHCSMFGAWGNATGDNSTVQLRALDWDFNGPYKKYPMAVVYHPASAKDGNTWMNIGFVGWIGILSGVNQHRMGISQIGVTYPDDTFGKESRIGNPFTFLLRDILQFDKNIEESITRMKKTRRTCNLILGVGDGKKQYGYFRGFQVSHTVYNVVNDTYPLPHNDTWHPALTNTIYWGMDWNCPSYHHRLHQMLNKYYGNITAQQTIRKILPGLNSGNLQAVVYDLSHDLVYIAYGYEAPNGTRTDAFMRPYVGLNLTKEFGRKQQQ